MTTTDAPKAQDDHLGVALKVLCRIATHYSAFQYNHSSHPIDPNTHLPSTGNEELRRVISAIELLLIHNGVGGIDEETGEYRTAVNVGQVV